jgi:hypothetical protein
VPIGVPALRGAKAVHELGKVDTMRLLEAHLANFLFAPRRRSDGFVGDDQQAWANLSILGASVI